MTRIPSPVLLLIAGLVGVGGCADRDEPLRDAWALWLEHRPVCVDSSGDTAAEPVAVPAATSPERRVPTARVALSGETLTIMEELLAEAGSRGERARLLAALVADSRRLCELVDRERVAALASTLAAAEAEVAAARSRLLVAMPLDEDEIRERVAPWEGRIADAVSRALESAAMDAVVVAEALEPPVGGASPSEGGGGGKAAGSPEEDELEEPIIIETASGESFEEMRQRRRAEAARRWARWRPLYDDGLEPLTAARGELAAALEYESLEGSRHLCARVGRAAEEVPVDLVRLAPSADLAANLGAMLAAYAAAGRGCSAGRLVSAWGDLASADERYAAVARAVEELSTGPPIPDSLRRKARTGNPATGRGVG